MTLSPTKIEPVPSPCCGICALDADQVCSGCGRTIDEIARWPQMSDAERRDVLKRLAERV